LKLDPRGLKLDPRGLELDPRGSEADPRWVFVVSKARELDFRADTNTQHGGGAAVIHTYVKVVSQQQTCAVLAPFLCVSAFWAR